MMNKCESSRHSGLVHLRVGVGVGPCAALCQTCLLSALCTQTAGWAVTDRTARRAASVWTAASATRATDAAPACRAGSAWAVVKVMTSPPVIKPIQLSSCIVDQLQILNGRARFFFLDNGKAERFLMCVLFLFALQGAHLGLVIRSTGFRGGHRTCLTPQVRNSVCYVNRLASHTIHHLAISWPNAPQDKFINLADDFIQSKLNHR